MELTSGRRTAIFINVMFTAFLASAIGTALSTALSDIGTEFNASDSVSWTVGAYTLVMAIIMPLSAFLVKRFHTKPLYLVGLALAIIGMVIDALSPNFIVLMGGRVLQACGDGILYAMGQVVVMSIYPIEKRGTYMGIFGIAGMAAPVIAPTLGGLICEALSWRWIFGFVAILMAASFLMALFVFKNVLPNEKSRFDILAFILSAFAFGGITFGIGNISTYGFGSLMVWPFLIIGVVGAILFVRRELHVDSAPLLDVRMFRNRAFSISVIGMLMLYFLIYGSTVLLPQFVQNGLSMTELFAGIVTLPGSLAMAIFSPFSGRIYDKIGMKMLFVVGAAVMVVSNLMMIPVEAIGGGMASYIYAIVATILRCLAGACFMSPLIAWGTMNVKKEVVADATAIISAMGQIGGSLGSTVLLGIMMSTVTGASANSAAEYTSGISLAFLAMTIVSVVMFLIGIFFVQGKKKEAAMRELAEEEDKAAQELPGETSDSGSGELPGNESGNIPEDALEHTEEIEEAVDTDDVLTGEGEVPQIEHDENLEP